MKKSVDNILITWYILYMKGDTQMKVCNKCKVELKADYVIRVIATERKTRKSTFCTVRKDYCAKCAETTIAEMARKESDVRY